MACLREYKYEILLKNATSRECEDYIKGHTQDAYLVPGGYKIKSIILIGVTSPVGFSESEIIFQFIKPCFGFFVLKLENEVEEIKNSGISIKRTEM
jgi:hypothetical protein